MNVRPHFAALSAPGRGRTAALLLGAFAGSCGLGSCARLPAADAATLPWSVPTAWSGATASAGATPESAIRWWSRFDDPTLSDLVERALRANTDLRSALAVVDQTLALRDAARAALLPTLGATASAERATAGTHSAANTFAAGLDAAWVPDVFGGARAALGAAEASRAASLATLGDVPVQVAAEVGLSYILLRSSQARLAIAADNLASERETLQITEWREQAGLVTALESAQARAAAEQTAASLPALRIVIEQTGHALALLTGAPPASLRALLAVAAPLPAFDQAVAPAIPAETLRQRADVRAAERQVVAALARVDQADAARLPSFSIGGTLGLSAATLSGLGAGSALVTSLLAGVSLPVLDGGAARAQVRVQQALVEQARAAYVASVLAALRDVEDALVALDGDHERRLRLGDAASAAVQANALARQRYAGGLVDFQTVLDTQRTQLGLQDSLAAAQADVGSDQVRLFKALGGGWRDDAAPASFVAADTLSHGGSR